MADEYSGYTTGPPYEGLKGFARTTLRGEIDPLGPLIAESERKIAAGTDKWIADREKKLQAFHDWEIRSLKTAANAKIQIEELSLKHAEEMRQLDEENTQKSWEYKLTMAEGYTTRLTSLFGTLYEAYGKQSKELFLLSKAASMATIIVKTAQGVMDALGTQNWPMALLIGAEGAAQMAVASAATMARGGLVPGYSPSKTADNIPLRGTAGEFMHPVDSVNYYGTPIHEAMRQRLIPRELFAGLNLPGAPAPSGGSLAGGGLVGGTGKTEFTILNYVDPQELLRALATPAGKDAVFNVLSSSPVRARRVLR